jgi:tRNA threonylcarbamoyl adenosine modification protein (Sua5/YciO/YrdC/YwlC family)
VPATREVPRRLQHPKRSTVGVRVPAHPVVQALLAELGEPLLSSTLILPGEVEPLNDADTIRDAIGDQLDLVIDAGACPAEPTTVIDLATPPAVIVRRGGGDPKRLGLEERDDG